MRITEQPLDDGEFAVTKARGLFICFQNCVKLKTSAKVTDLAIHIGSTRHNTPRYTQTPAGITDMRQLQPVVWSKGVFLSPQHLQAQDRFFGEALRFLVEALSSPYWGFTQLQIDGTALSEGQLAISQAGEIGRAHV